MGGRGGPGAALAVPRRVWCRVGGATCCVEPWEGRRLDSLRRGRGCRVGRRDLGRAQGAWPRPGMSREGYGVGGATCYAEDGV